MLPGAFWTFVDCLAASVVEPGDRVEFLAAVAALIVRGRSAREERSCVVACACQSKLRQSPALREKPRPLCLVTMRLWSDTGTQSFVFAVQAVRLPTSKHLELAADLEASKRRRGQLLVPPATSALLKSTQQVVARSKESAKWVQERELLTEEQVIAEMLPLDELLELDDFDIEAVAEVYSVESRSAIAS
jgi:hypothetical protein